MAKTEDLKEQIVSLRKQQEQAREMFHQCEGAIQVLNKMLEPDVEPKPEKVVKK